MTVNLAEMSRYGLGGKAKGLFALGLWRLKITLFGLKSIKKTGQVFD